jgi:hypothetical protein
MKVVSVRKPNSIKHKRDLPGWFSLSKYDSARTLGLVEWYEQLSLRGYWRRSVESWRRGEANNSNFPRNPPGLEEILNVVWEKPIFTMHVLEQAIGDRGPTYGLGALREFKAKASSEVGVHPLTVEEFYLNELWLVAEKRDFARKFFSEIADTPISNLEKIKPYQAVLQRIVEFRRRMLRTMFGTSPIDKYLQPARRGLGSLRAGLGRQDKSLKSPRSAEYQAWMGEPIHIHQLHKGITEVQLSVDLALPDTLLHQQFRKQLERLRIARPGEFPAPPLRFAKPDFGSWIEMGILPYLDLTLWASLKDVNIPNRVMADAIYPDGEGDPERVRKVTKTLADDLTRDEFSGAMRDLSAQAALEFLRSGNAEGETA